MAVSARKREGWSAAQDARLQLKLGLGAPVPDLLRLLEGSPHGVPVAVLPLPEEVAGAYAHQQGRSFLFVNRNDWPERQRFTLSHEFGHHRLGHRVSVVDSRAVLAGKTKDPQEVQANAFAAEFLVPREALRDWVEARTDDVLDLETAVRAASYFGVSAYVIRYRLEDAGLLRSAADRRALDQQLEQGQHRALLKRLGLPETDDSLAAIRRARVAHLPAEMRDNAFRAFEKGLVPEERLAAGLRRGMAAIRKEIEERGIHEPEPEPDY